MLERQSLKEGKGLFDEQSRHLLRLIQDNYHSRLPKLAQFIRWEIELIDQDEVHWNVICTTASKETQKIGTRIPKRNIEGLEAKEYMYMLNMICLTHAIPPNTNFCYPIGYQYQAQQTNNKQTTNEKKKIETIKYKGNPTRRDSFLFVISFPQFSMPCMNAMRIHTIHHVPDTFIQPHSPPDIFFARSFVFGSLLR